MVQKTIFACKLTAFLLSFCTNLLAPLLLPIRADLGVGLGQSGLLLSAFFAGNFAACLFAGRIMERFGKARVLCCALTLMAAFSACIACAPRFVLLCALLFGTGACSLGLQIATNAIPADLDGTRAASAIAGVMALNGLGACGGLLLGGALATLGLPWRIAYLVFAVGAAAAAAFCWRVAFPQAVCTAGESGLRGFLRKRRYWPVLLCCTLYSGAESAVCSWLSTFLVQEQRFSALAGAGVTAVIWLCIFLGRAGCERAARRVSAARLLFALIPACIFMALLLPLLHGAAFWPAAAVLGLGLSGIWPLLVGRVMEHGAADSMTVLSAAFLFSFLGNSIVPFAVGLAAERVGIAAALALCAVPFFAVFALFLLWLHGEKRAAPLPALTLERQNIA